MASPSASGVKAAAPALVAGVLLAVGAYIVERDAWAASVLGGAAAIIGFVMLGFPDVANRPIWGRSRTPGERVRRATGRLLVFGLVIVVLGFLLDSLVLMALALAFLLFWFVLLATRKVRG
jgi:hypothetical protein